MNSGSGSPASTACGSSATVMSAGDIASNSWQRSSFGYIASSWWTARNCDTRARSCLSSSGYSWSAAQRRAICAPSGRACAVAPAPRNGVHAPSATRASISLQSLSCTSVLCASLDPRVAIGKAPARVGLILTAEKAAGFQDLAFRAVRTGSSCSGGRILIVDDDPAGGPAGSTWSMTQGPRGGTKKSSHHQKVRSLTGGAEQENACGALSCPYPRSGSSLHAGPPGAAQVGRRDGVHPVRAVRAGGARGPPGDERADRLRERPRRSSRHRDRQPGRHQPRPGADHEPRRRPDRKSTRLNSSHANISYAVFCLKKKKRHSEHAECKSGYGHGCADRGKDPFP